jgi:hypothetical protein
MTERLTLAEALRTDRVADFAEEADARLDRVIGWSASTFQRDRNASCGALP